MSDHVHVHPVEDAIEHEITAGAPDCVCGPIVFPRPREAEADGEFTAHARADIPWLLDLVEELRARTGEIGSLLSLPIVIDDTLPSGRVELRDRGGNATRAWRLEAPAACAEHTGAGDSGMPERFVAIDPAPGGEDTFVSGWRGPDGRVHIDGARHAQIDPADLRRRFAVLFSEQAAGLNATFSAIGVAVRRPAEDLHSAARHALPDLELEAARHWPAPSRAVCAHVCGADAGHRCDARASTSLRFTLPSGGLRDLPLCGPCAQAESAPSAPPHGSPGYKEWLKAHINRLGADGDRACPACGLPMFYAPSTGQHACQDPDCEHAHPGEG